MFKAGDEEHLKAINEMRKMNESFKLKNKRL